MEKRTEKSIEGEGSQAVYGYSYTLIRVREDKTISQSN
jgi:hypothetical protein